MATVNEVLLAMLRDPVFATSANAELFQELAAAVEAGGDADLSAYSGPNVLLEATDGTEDMGIILSVEGVGALSIQDGSASVYAEDLARVRSDGDIVVACLGAGDISVQAGTGGTLDLLAPSSIQIYSEDNGNITVQADGGSVNVHGAGVNIEDESGDGVDIESAGSIDIVAGIGGNDSVNLRGTGTGGVSVAAGAGRVGFYGTAPIAKQTGVAVTAEGIHAALVALGLIAA